MLFLLAALTSSLFIAQLFKMAEVRQYARWIFLTANYLSALVTAVVVLWIENPEIATKATNIPSGLLLLGTVSGALFIGAFFLFGNAVNVAGMSIAVGVMRVSVVLPFLASWLIWNEIPTLFQGVGMVVAVAAFFMIAHTRHDGSGYRSRLRVFGASVLLFLGGGTVDIFLKTFQETWSDDFPESLFLIMVFGFALLTGIVILYFANKPVEPSVRKASFVFGLVLGVFNYSSTDLFLRALTEIPGTLAFPVLNIGLVLGVAVIGWYFWNETLSRENRFGLFLAIMALIMMNSCLP